MERIFYGRLLAAAAGLALAAAGCAADPGSCQAEFPASVRALFRVAPGARTAFPADQFTRADPDTPTGRRLALTAESTPVLAPAMGVLMNKETLAGLLQAHDGFSAWAPLLVPLDGPLDPVSLPASPADTTRDTSSVFLLDLDGAPPQRIPIQVWPEAFEADGAVEQLLVIQPVQPLTGGRRHALVVTDGVRAEDGSPLGATTDTAYALGRCPIPDAHPGRELLADQREALAVAGLDPERTALAVVFTVQSVPHLLDSARRSLRAQAPSIDLDGDGDGAPDFCPPGELPGAPPSAQHLQHVAGVLRGTFDAPVFRAEDGTFHLDASGAPVRQGNEQVPFLLALPADPAAQPCPLVILQHGHGGEKERLMYLAGHLAAHGLATTAIDLVEHGERPNTGHGFFDLSNLLGIRAAFAQSALDQMRLIQALEGLADLDLIPGGAGDGLPDLDLSRQGLLGESAGAQVVSLVGALEPSVGAVVINVGGGGYSDFLDQFVGGLFDARTMLPLSLLVQTLFDPADPVVFNRPYIVPDEGPPAVQSLIQEVIDDDTFPNRCTENLARSYGSPQVRPIARSVAGLIEVDAPAPHLGLFQYHPARHGFLLAGESDMEASEAVRRQAAAFLATYFETGTALIEDPW